MTALVQAFRSGQKQLADPIYRVALAAPVGQGLLLHSPAHLVQTAVADAHHAKGSATRVACSRCDDSPAR